MMVVVYLVAVVQQAYEGVMQLRGAMERMMMQS